MSSLPDEICLNWRRFRSWKEISSFVNRADGPVSCIYAQADTEGTVLRIGKTTKLRGRYWSDAGTLDAAMHNSGNCVYVGIPVRCADGVTPRDVDTDPKVWWELIDAEAELIFRVKPKYNSKGKDSLPSRRVNLRHLGDTPKI